MNLFMKMFKILQATAHSVVSKFEDPVKLTEQAIRDLKKDFDESIKNFTKAKAISIGVKKEIESKKQQAVDYEQKAIMLLKKAKDKELDEKEAESLAASAIKKKQELLADVKRMSVESKNYDEMLAKMEEKIAQLKNQIQKYEAEYQSLKARATVAKTTIKVNKQLSSLDYSSATSMIEEMKEKLAQEENLALAGQETLAIDKLDDKIDKALGNSNLQVQEELTMLKQNLIGLNDDSTDEIKKLKDELDK